MINFKSYLMPTLFILLSGCAGNVELSDEAKFKPLVKADLPKPQQARGNTYAREITTNEVLTKEVKRIAASDITLMELFVDIMPSYQVVPGDPGVNLDQIIKIRQHETSTLLFLDYLEKLTGYDIEVKGSRLIVLSFITKTWNLATFSDNRTVLNRSVSSQSTVVGDDSGSGGEGGSSTSTSTVESELVKEDDEWSNLIAGAEKHLDIMEEDTEDEFQGADSSSIGGAYDTPVPVNYETLLDSSATDGSPQPQQYSPTTQMSDVEKPYVHGIRSLGLITAAGPVTKIRNLDNYFKAAIKASQVVFNIQASTYEVTLDEKKERGIDWTALASGTINSNPISFVFTQSKDPRLSNGLFKVTGSYTGSDFNINSAISFLKEFGEVELVDQPSISARNGSPAKIYGGTELTFIADIEVTTTDTGAVVETPRFGRLQVGVTLAVTARLLNDDKILLDIWPIISSINGSESFSVNGFVFEAPTISRKELTTQVITTSGRPIYLGGIITKKIMKTLSGLPVTSNKGISGILKAPFEQTANEIERSELVMVVTPTIVESSL
jgi:type II secretory pathway component GspD/PulD (secretin)